MNLQFSLRLYLFSFFTLPLTMRDAMCICVIVKRDEEKCTRRFFLNEISWMKLCARERERVGKEVQYGRMCMSEMKNSFIKIVMCIHKSVLCYIITAREVLIQKFFVDASFKASMKKKVLSGGLKRSTGIWYYRK